VRIITWRAGMGTAWQASRAAQLRKVKNSTGLSALV